MWWTIFYMFMAQFLIESAADNGGKLSHTSGEAEDVAKNGFKSRLDLISNSQTDIKMKDDEHFEKFVRPRSFSDTSATNVNYGYLKSLRDKIRGRKGQEPSHKTSVKVFVRRETEQLKAGTVDKTERHNDGFSAYNSSNMEAGQDLLARSRSTGLLSEDDSMPPPKPKLPENYKLYSAKSLDYSSVHDSLGRKRPVLQKQVLGISGHGTDSTKTSSNTEKPAGKRQSRLSESDTLGRRVNVIYRHCDTQQQNELLQKELNQLRSSEHVKKQGEAVRQLLIEENKPNPKGSRVRFSADFTSQRTNTGTKKNSDLNSYGARKMIKQSRSLDLPDSGSQIVAEVINLPANDPHLAVRTDHPPSGSSVYRNINVDSDKKSVRELAQRLKDDLDQELLEPRRGLILQRGQGQSRSKSESVVNRTSMQRSKSSVGEYGRLSEEQRNIQMSRSTTNLRRKCDTITRHNNLEMEKKREKVRLNFERKKTHDQWECDTDGNDVHDVKQSKLKNRFDTIRKYNNQEVEQMRERVRENYIKNWRKLIDQQSDEETEDLRLNQGNKTSLITDESELQKSNNKSVIENTTIGRKNDNLAKTSQTREYPVRPDKLVSDNRSDEEKYAALSRHKILHSKSSSLDSHLQPSESHSSEIRSEATNKKFGIMGIAGVRPDNSKKLLADVPKSFSNPLTSSIDRNEAHSDSETVIKGSKTHKFENQPKLVVRQCRIGTSVAFGLVGVANSEPNGNGYLDGQGLVTIRMIPDEQGRFGFNVKGGADQGMPIIVSRVAPNTPADNAIPRLSEGDQVLYINGRDVSQHTHEQVVMFIRASRETHSGELVLKVRPNAYSADDNCDEPDLTYDPETHQISSATGGANALDLSLKLLEESLESTAALAQFEQLYRKKPGMTMNAARLEINVPKNRYRDISPYDQTRVIMKNNPNGDYINANYVNMEIPVSGIVNRYIAAQGPLPATCSDFWQMIWEQQSTLVVMLTTKVERGRIKCHQYWPDLYETSDYGPLQITCVKEEETSVFAFREFNLTHVESQEERHISHMQYIAWPDHGVPDDPVDFLDFVTKVRQKRVGIVEPIIVHCSAGIGRTGVLITMETAMCLTEANQPVYPLSIVRQMRDQRAMLIQTPNQYKFVCEAIIRAYNEGIVKPLPEYSQR